MTPFARVEREAPKSMEHRLALLQQPCEFFRQFFHGRTPSMEEKAMHVERVVQRMNSVRVFENNLYHVEIAHGEPFIHLDISRRDGGPCTSWRHFQRIKNELVGPEHEAFELFPAESRSITEENRYHLWVHATPGYRFPVGSQARFVLEEPVIYERYTLCPDGGGSVAERTLAVDSMA